MVEEAPPGLARERGKRHPVAERGEEQALGIGVEARRRLGEDAVRVIDRGRGRDREGAAQEVRDGAVGAMRVVRRAPHSGDARAAGAGVGDDLLDEPRLAEAGLPDDRDDATFPRERLLERAHEERDLLVAADERRAPPLARAGGLRA